MKVYLESDVTCTVDGVGLLEPGRPVEVDSDYFQLFHGVRPTEANFPPTIHVVVDTERSEDSESAEKPESVEEEEVR